MFDSQRLYQQQKELQKMSGFNKQLVIEPPQTMAQFDNQRNYATVSLFCLTVTNPFRDRIIRIVLNAWFDRFILLTILINCVFLAIDDPNLEQLDYQVIADYIFLIIFTLEMFFKIIAMGFALRPYSYLRDTWNILDFIVVILGWASKMSTASNISAIRVIRILRPLRTINSMPGMRKLVQSLLNSLPTLFDILLLFSFFLIMFGTIATQLFGGLLQNRCVDENGVVQGGNDGNQYFCNQSEQCPGAWTCENVGNPDYEVTSFDNILKSVLNIFIIITLEGWTDTMYKIRSATGTVAYDIFFILVVMLGAFFVLNLMVAVQFSYLNAQFVADSQLEAEKEKAAQNALALKDATPKTPIDNKGEGDDPNQDNFNDGFSQAVEAVSPEQPNENSQKAGESESGQPLQENKEGEKAQKKKRCAFFGRFQHKIFLLVESTAFNVLIIVLILINTLFMAMEHYDMPEDLTTATNTGNSILTVIFAVEMLLKLLGLGIKLYVKDGFNDFDAIIVIIGLLEFVNVGSKAFTVLRAFRLLRTFKIVKSWTTLKKLLQTVLNSFSSIANLGLLMFLLIFIYALIGMQFFSGEIPDNEDESFRYNFNSFGYSLITIFVLLTAENWNSILYQFIEKDGFGASIYFVSVIIFGNIMILNLFLAILLNFISDNLDQEEGNQPVEGEGNQNENEIVEEQFDYIQERLRIKAGIKQSVLNQQNQSKSQDPTPVNKSDAQLNNQSNTNENNNNNNINIEDIQVNLENDNEPQIKISEQSNEENSPNNEKEGNQIEVSQKEDDTVEHKKIIELKLNQSENNSESVTNFSKTFNKKLRKTKNTPSLLNIQGRSLFIFGQNSRIRSTLRALLQHPYFENLIYHLIALNSILLALDEPTQNNNGYDNMTLDFTVNIISGIFIFEAVCKIIVLGFVFGKGTYLRDSWNILDFAIVVISILNWVLDSMSSINISFLRGFRALRALRPLRMVSKNEGMKIVVNSLLTSIPSLINVMLVSILFFLVFGILGIQLFKGAVGECNDGSKFYKRECIGFFNNDDGDQIERRWIVPVNNFDDIFHSMMTFFEVATLENWVSVLFRTIDSTDIDQGPIINNRPYVAFLFVAFIFITTFFVMNLFISVIVDKFNEEIRKKEGSHNFSEEQKEWVKMQRIMVHVKLKIKPVMPEKNKLRKYVFKLVQDNKFEFFISIIIALNTLFLCMDYYEDPYAYDKVLEIGNIIFVSIFTIEAALKIIGYGFRYYFLENWNRFDFVIVILSLIALDESIFSFKVNALRIIRVARLLRMVKASKGLRHLLKTLWLSLGNIANVGMLLFLIFFTFSVAGLDLFGDIIEGEYINDNASFRSFYKAMMLLFRSSTGENWNGVMHDCIEQKGLIAALYWIAFELITHYIFLNVFIAVIYENFNDVKASEDENEVLSLKRKDIKAFVKTWAIFCPNGEHYLKTTQFSQFLRKLPPPLGYDGHKIEQSKLNKIIFCLNIRNHIKDNEGKVYFPEVMWAIFHSIIGNNDEQVHRCEQVINIMKELKRKYKGLGKGVTPDSLCGNKYYRTEMTVSKYLCALAIYKNWKRFKLQRERNRLLREQQEAKDVKLSARKGSNVGQLNQSSAQIDQIKLSDISDANLLNNQDNFNSIIKNSYTQDQDEVNKLRGVSQQTQQEEEVKQNFDDRIMHPNQQTSLPLELKSERSKDSQLQLLQTSNILQEKSNNLAAAINDEASSFESEDLSEDLEDDKPEKDKHLQEDNTNSRQIIIDFAGIKGSSHK